MNGIKFISDQPSYFSDLPSEIKDDMIIARAVARLRHENISSEEDLSAVRSGSAEYADAISEAILQLHNARFLTNRNRMALITRNGCLAKEMSSLILQLNGTGFLTEKQAEDFIEVVAKILLNHGMEIAKEMCSAISDLNQANFLREGGIDASAALQEFENLQMKALFSKDNFSHQITQKRSEPENAVVRFPLPSLSPASLEKINLQKQLIALERIRTFQLERIQQYKEEAMEEGIPQLAAELFATRQFEEEIKRKREGHLERTRRLLEVNQEPLEKSSESSNISEKAPSKIHFNPIYTIQKINLQTKELVGSLEKSFIENVKTREDYRFDYAKDYCHQPNDQRKRKREPELSSTTPN